MVMAHNIFFTTLAVHAPANLKILKILSTLIMDQNQNDHQSVDKTSIK